MADTLEVVASVMVYVYDVESDDYNIDTIGMDAITQLPGADIKEKAHAAFNKTYKLVKIRYPATSVEPPSLYSEESGNFSQVMWRNMHHEIQVELIYSNGIITDNDAVYREGAGDLDEFE